MDAETKDRILQAEMVLIGVGGEFEDRRLLKGNPSYEGLVQELEEKGLLFCLPLRLRRMQEQAGSRALEALKEAAGLVQGRNYFVIGTCAGGILEEAGFDRGRLVMPCGSLEKKQCPMGCPGGLGEISGRERAALMAGKEISLGLCPECGRELVLNNIFQEKYDERGYREDWARYTNWIKGTLNKRLCIVELGVGMEYPGVIRWPFETAAFYNQKAFLVRVHEKLYQLPENLKGRGRGIGRNAVDWMLGRD